MGLFSRRVMKESELLAAEGPNFCRGFVELQYSKCYHISFLIQMKNKVQNFLRNHILKNNVRLDAETYCNNTWNLFYIAMLNLLDNAETSLKWWVFHKQKMQLLQNQNGAQWHYWNVLCLSHGENSLLVSFMFDRIAFFWRKNIPLGNSSANMGVRSRLPIFLFLFSENSHCGSEVSGYFFWR